MTTAEKRDVNRRDYLARKDKRKIWRKERERGYRKTPLGWVRLAIQNVKSRAKKNGIVFRLSVADVCMPTHCPITLCELRYGCGLRDWDGPSLDRVIPALGYVPGNVRVISLAANTMKQTCTDPAVFDRLAAYLRG